MKLQSYTITQGKDRAAARSQLKAIGFTDEDLKKPIIGIANTWIGAMPCNFKLRDLAVKVAEGIRKAGGTPMEYNTIAISDGITMGTEGMKASLVSRDLIADSIELVAADERSLHALGSHGDAVADGDGVVFHGRAAGLANALGHFHREIPELEIA